MCALEIRELPHFARPSQPSAQLAGVPGLQGEGGGKDPRQGAPRRGRRPRRAFGMYSDGGERSPATEWDQNVLQDYFVRARIRCLMLMAVRFFHRCFISDYFILRLPAIPLAARSQDSLRISSDPSAFHVGTECSFVYKLFGYPEALGLIMVFGLFGLFEVLRVLGIFTL